MLSVTHVAFDGVGSLRLLQSVSRLYASEDDPEPDLEPVEAQRAVEERRSTGGSGPAPGQRSARLAPVVGGSGTGFGILHLDLDAAEATASGVATVNDVLLAALHLAVEQWNRSQGAGCDLVSVMMPVNQRSSDWRGDVVANLVLPGRVDSTRAQRATPTELLATVAAQTARIKRGGVGGSSDPVPRWTPVVLRRLLPHLIDAASDRADTAVLSNLGRVDDPPWFGVEGRGVWFSPPPRDPVILTVGAATARTLRRTRSLRSLHR